MNSKRLLFFQFSNQLEYLVDQLVNELKNGRPFDKIWIVVPSLAIKNYLKNKLANMLGICMHVEFLLIQHAVHKVVKMCYLDATIETQTHLALQIQLKIQELIASDELLPLRDFLEFDGKDKLNIQKLISLSDHLSSQFITYSLYIPDLQVQFEKNFSNHWQKVIWDATFKQVHSFNSEPNKILEQPVEHQIDPHRIFFLNINFMPKPIFKLFDRVKEFFSIEFLQLSPCLFYWSDIYSDQERVRLVHKLKKINNSSLQITQLEEYLLDVNPLLANLSKLGKNWIKYIESLENESHEHYAVSKAVAEHINYQDWINPNQLKIIDQPLTLLRAVQADLLLMRTSQVKVKIAEFKSIQIHKASTYQREVEILYQNLITLLHERPELKPRDIIVYVANIESYIPFIESIFNEPSSPLEALIYNGVFAINNKALKAICLLLELPFAHFDQSKLLEFFYQSAFCQRFNLALETVHLWKTWLEEIGPCMGFDTLDQDLYFKKQYHQEIEVKDRIILSWQDCIETLLKYCCQFSPKSDLLPSVSAMDLSQSDELNLLMTVLFSLKEDLDILTNHKMTFANWSGYVKCLLESYYYFSQEDQKEAEIILDFIHHFQKNYSDFQNEVFDFQTYYYYLKKELLNLQSDTSQYQLESISFYSIFNSSPAPAKITCLLGLNDQVFPRTNNEKPLSLLYQFKNKDYYPQIMDQDRNLFLEVLLATSEYLLISYLGNCLETFKPKPPSILIVELLNYLDNYFEVCHEKPSTQIFFQHPHLNFNKKYFSDKNFQTKSYPLAQAFYQQTKSTTQKPEFIWGNYNSIASKLPNIKSLSIQQLTTLAKDPIQFALKNFHQVYLKLKDDRRDHQNFALSNLQKSILKKQIFSSDFLSNNHELPRGIFYSLSKERLEEEQQEVLSLLHSNGLQKTDLFSVELRSDIQHPHFFENRIWVCPSLKLSLHPHRVIEITGTLDAVTPKGLLSMSLFSQESMWAELPKYLMYSILQKVIPLNFQSQWIFIKSKKIKELSFNDPQKYLQLYLQLYFLNSNQILPFLPQWIPMFLYDDPREILKKIYSDIQSEHFYYPYLRKIMGKQVISIRLVEQWKQLILEMFSELDEILKK